MYRLPAETNRRRKQRSVSTVQLAPTGGWDASSSLANMPQDRARRLDNWFPLQTEVRARRGSETHCGLSGATAAVETIAAYYGVDDRRLFAWSGGSIFDVTNAGTSGAADVTGLSNSRWEAVNFRAAGDSYLWTCNGVDEPQVFDGSAWSNPTINNIDSFNIAHVCVHKSRLWFCLTDSLTAAYLGVGAFQGDATEFDLGPVMSRGGTLLAAITWSQDTGAGPDDRLVFITDRGQCAVYAGTDPDDPTAWAIVGVYDIGEPLGKRCLYKVAGDVAIVCIDGVIPLSLALRQDRAAIQDIAVTKNINNAMNQAARSYRANFGWQLIGYPKGTAAILNVPVTEGGTQHQYVMNTLSGAWCRYLGMNAACWAVFDDALYFGSQDGRVMLADTGASDDGDPIHFYGWSAPNYFGDAARNKLFLTARALVNASRQVGLYLGLSIDYEDVPRIASYPTLAEDSGAVYGVAVYGVDVYAVNASFQTTPVALSGYGRSASVIFEAYSRGDGEGVWGEGLWDVAPWGVASGGEVQIGLTGVEISYQPGGPV